MPQKLILFAENGDSVAESPGTMWDLLANAGGVDKDFDGDKMTVVITEGGTMQALSLGPALRKIMDESERSGLIETLEARAAGYKRLADWLREQESEVPPEEPPAAEVRAEVEATEAIEQVLD